MRRPPIRTAAVGLALVLVLLCSACDWTQFMGNAALNGGDPSETTITTANVAQLAPTFRVAMPAGSGPTFFTPIVADGDVYAGTNTGTLVAAGAGGTTGCSGTPTVCQPLWTASNPGLAVVYNPVLAGNEIITAFANPSLSTGELAAYDRTGTTNCSGTPKVCQPLWTAPVTSASPPNVDDGTVFINDVATGRLEAFDAAGTTNCSGTPKVCQPLWTAAALSYDTPTVAGGRVYISQISVAPETVMTFDEAGTTACGGSPKVCAPEFTVDLPPPAVGHFGAADVSGGVGYVTVSGQLVAFDADGTTNCTSAPLRCQPLWAGPLLGTSEFVPPAVANGRVYVPTDRGATVYDTDDSACSGSAGTTLSCQALYADGSASTVPDNAAMVAGGLLVVGSNVFDAAGARNCAGVAPTRTCSPLWTSPNTGAAIVIANGTLYVHAGATITTYRVPGT